MNGRAGKLLWMLAVFLLLAGQARAEVAVRDIRLWTAPENSRIVFDLSGSVDYRLFRLHDPERIVLDLKGARLRADPGKLALPDAVIASIRHGSPKKGLLRIVLDVREQVGPRSFLLKPMHGKPWRLVVDLQRKAGAKPAVSAAGARRKGLVIAVDAGHGGEDPGAIGPHGVKEKDVTLAVARKLARMIDAKPGMRAVLIRKGDYFVPLAARWRKARRAHADVMISIHADSVRRGRAKGASVYMLYERGATPDKAAAALAAKENASDAIGGVPVAEQVNDPEVERILGDMFRRDSLESSRLLAESIISELRRIGPVKYAEPKRARFVVLGAMEIPSVLVELDFISNPERERRLRDRRHQQRLAAALLRGSMRFLERMGRLKPQGGKARAEAGRGFEAAQL